MTTHQLIASRRTCFQFADRPVAEDLLLRALDAARWAPNHKRTEPWRFLVAGPKLNEALGAHFQAKLAAKLRARGEAEANIAIATAKPNLVPAQVVVTQVLAQGDPYRQHEDFASVACVVQNLMLALWADGVASGWKSFDAPECYELLGLNPEEERIVALVQLGYPLQEREGKRLKALGEVLRRSE